MKATQITRYLLVVLVSLLALMVSTMPAGAQSAPTKTYTFTVNTTADTHDAHPGDGKCADKTGQCSLRAAIEEADALPAGSIITITVPAGTYGLTLGTLGLTANTSTINGAGRKTTIIKGNQTFGILSISSSSPVQLSRLTIEGGGGNGGGINNTGTLTVSNSAITANINSGINNIGTMTVNNSAITANNGGGIYNEGNNTLLTVSNSTISGNSTTGGGGGIFNVGYATVSISNSTISGNSATGSQGGGIYDGGYHGGSSVSVSNSTISGNSVTSGDGGAIDFPGSDGGSVSVSNSTISGNSATGVGGNIADLNINGPFTLTGTIVANSKGAPNCSRMITDQGYNLDSGTSCGFSLSTDLTNTDPMLGPLGNNGGPTQTMALLQGSKAIDWVALSRCPANDQRGYTRPDGSGESTCDIGAYESAY